MGLMNQVKIVYVNDASVNVKSTFTAPNIITIYVNNTHTLDDMFETVMHELMHFMIASNKILSFIFKQLNTRVINKGNERGLCEDRISRLLPEEKFCRFMARSSITINLL